MRKHASVETTGGTFSLKNLPRCGYATFGETFPPSKREKSAIPGIKESKVNFKTREGSRGLTGARLIGFSTARTSNFCFSKVFTCHRRALGYTELTNHWKSKEVQRARREWNVNLTSSHYANVHFYELSTWVVNLSTEKIIYVLRNRKNSSRENDSLKVRSHTTLG